MGLRLHFKYVVVICVSLDGKEIIECEWLASSTREIECEKGSLLEVAKKKKKKKKIN